MKGFTLIEILIVIAIVGLVLSFGMSIDLSAFKRNNFQAEEATIVSVLERARSHAMANLFDADYGVCYIAPDYAIFRDGSCDGLGTDETIPANINIAEHVDTVFPTVIFDQLAGTTSGATIHIEDGIKEADIKINEEGTISW